MPSFAPVEASVRTIARRQVSRGAEARSAERSGMLCARSLVQDGKVLPKRCTRCKSYTRIERRLKCNSGKARQRSARTWTRCSGTWSTRGRDKKKE